MDTALNPDAVVTLREVTTENFRDILTLRVSPEQREYVASNDRSVAEAHFHQEAWFRAIYADETPVGFLMLHDDNLREEVDLPPSMCPHPELGCGCDEWS
jgi:diamine N-acetyltransferase